VEKFGLTPSEDPTAIASDRAHESPGGYELPDDERSPTADDQRFLGRFGAHLSAVLRAAGDAAAQIETEAREEAQHILAEASEQRADAETWANQTRAEAESYADRRRTEADAEAETIIAEADRRAQSVDEEAQRRQEALAMDISLAEDRLRQLASGLHEAGGRLEELLGAPDDVRDEDVGPEADSLTAALAPSRGAEEEAAT